MISKTAIIKSLLLVKKLKSGTIQIFMDARLEIIAILVLLLRFKMMLQFIIMSQFLVTLLFAH